MRILLLCHAFNSLSQRLYCELAGRGHQLSVEYDIADSVTDEAVALFRLRIDVARRARELALAPDLADRLRAKRARRQADELQRPLASYRAAELAELERNFYGFDLSYHVARHHFVHKTAHSWTPRHLAIHRGPGWQGRE